MATWILTYAEIGDRGELIRHKEEFPSKFSAGVNLFFSERNPRRVNCRLTKEEKKWK